MTTERDSNGTIKKQSQSFQGNGVANTQLAELLPIYNETDSEKVIEGQNNTYIVLGRDRPADINSGYGGKGRDKCGSIDIVAGRTSAIIKNSEDDKKVFTDPSIPYDASRVLISQRTDGDDNFYLPGKKIKNKSFIVVKSDNVRVVAREAIKLVTNIDVYDSNGDKKITKYGTELYATDGKDLQPMTKGDNLSELLSSMLEQIGQNTSEITSIYKLLLSIIKSISFHTHPASVGFTAPSLEIAGANVQHAIDIGLHVVNNQNQQVNNTMTKMKYLTLGSKKFINSKYHKLD
jgi:hypothetical protein